MPSDRPLAVLLNGPLGVGKSTMGEALGEAIDRSVTLDGDALAALTPPPVDELTHLHATLALVIGHHHRSGYDRFIINHYWSTRAQIEELRDRLQAAVAGIVVRCFRLSLSKEENLRRIALRQQARAIDEVEFEARHFAEEYALLSTASGGELGEPFDVSAPPEVLVERMLGLLDLPAADDRSGAHPIV